MNLEIYKMINDHFKQEKIMKAADRIQLFCTAYVWKHKYLFKIKTKKNNEFFFL